MVLHVKFEFHSNRDTLIYFTAKNKSKSFICIDSLKNHIAASDLVHTYIVSVLIPTDFRHGWAIFGPLADKNTWKGVLLELPASEKFSGLFCTCCEISVWNLAYTSSGWCRTSSSKFHSNRDTLTYFTGKNRSKSFICIHDFKNYIEASYLVHTQMMSVLTLLIFVMLGQFLALCWTKTLERGS